MATASSSKSSSSSSKASTTTSVAAVKAQQIALNALGANLKVDGIAGPKTLAAQAQFSSGGAKGSTPAKSANVVKPATPVIRPASTGGKSTSTTYATPTKQASTKVANASTATTTSSKNISPDSIGSSSSKVIQYKDKTFGNPFDGGFFNNLKGGLKMLGQKIASIPKGNLGANALEATVGENLTPAQGDAAYRAIGSTASTTDTGLLNSSGKPMQVMKTAVSPLDTAAATKSGGITAPVAADANTGLVDEFGTPINAPAVDSGAQTLNQTQAMSSGGLTTGAVSPTVSFNPSISTNTNNALNVLASRVGTVTNDPWNKYNKPNDMITIQESFKNEIAKQFDNPQSVQNEYQNNSAFASSINEAAAKTNTTPEKLLSDIMTKAVPATSGIKSAQTTAEYLAGGPAALKQIKDAMNQQIQDTVNWTAEQKKLLIGDPTTDGLLQQQKAESQAMIDLLTRNEMNRENSEREKAQFAIDKAKAEFDASDAETELNRGLARENLINFLAKIGALNTDANAGLGLATLEQKYQAQRQALRNNFELASREINMNMNSAINDLQSARDEKVFKLNQDLSKTEREITIDVMKLDYDLKKETSDAKLKYAEMIKSEKDKAAAKASSAAKGWEAAFFDTVSTADYFNSLPAEFKASWKANNAAPTDGTRTTLSGNQGLTQDFANWQKAQGTKFELTNTQRLDLEKQGVNTEAYVSDPEYRAAVNSKLK